MSNGYPFNPNFAARPPIIADRIGPIFDPAYLKLIPHDKLKEIVMIQLRAQSHVIKQEMEAFNTIVELVDKIEVR